MANFDLAYEITAKNEGGYANDPNDRGGETYCGISRKIWPNWAGWFIVDAHKPLKSNQIIEDETLKQHVKNFYKTNFWDKCRLDEFLNFNISACVFDFAVTSGTVNSIKAIQRATNYLNSNSNLIVDGAIGPKTIVAVNAYKSPKALNNTFNWYRADFYNNIVVNDKTNTQWKFKNTWFNRI